MLDYTPRPGLQSHGRSVRSGPGLHRKADRLTTQTTYRPAVDLPKSHRPTAQHRQYPCVLCQVAQSGEVMRHAQYVPGLTDRQRGEVCDDCAKRRFELLGGIVSQPRKGPDTREAVMLSCGHYEYGNGHCAEMVCHNYTGKHRQLF